MAFGPTARRVALRVSVVLVLSGCSGGTGPEPEENTGSRRADVTFARQSIVAHAETLLLVDEAARRGASSPRVSAAAEEIRAERTADVEALTELLEQWGEPVPATARDHIHAGHGGTEELAELRQQRGVEFEEVWLDLMVDHHEDALDLAETEVEEGRDADAVRVARDMAKRLTEQVRQLERLED
jgi:uncharacterized protein (DUF305 family)